MSGSVKPREGSEEWRECLFLDSEKGAMAFFDVFAMPADAKNKDKPISS